MRLSYVMLVVAVIGCGGGGGGDGYTTGPTGGTNSGGPGGTGGGSGTAGATASVSATQSDDGYGTAVFSFSPPSVSITRGGTVTWTNESNSTQHNITFITSGSPANAANFTASSGSVSRTFPTAGTYSYHCTNHAGMDGTVKVQ